MEKIKNIKSYILTSFLPILVILITGFILKPNDCGQCVLLIIMGAFLALISLLVLNSVLFINLIRVKNKLLNEIVIVTTFLVAPIISTIFVFNNYFIGEKDINTDFKIAFPSLILTYILAFKYSFEIIRLKKK